MKKLIIMAFAMTFLLCISFPVQAYNIDKKSEEATSIVSGKIKQIKSFSATNKWGDNLIMSEITLTVDKVHKGEQVNEVTFIVEGGIDGDIVLKVSSVPFFEEGEELILYLKKKEDRFHYLDSKKIELSGAKAKTPPPSKPTLSCCKTFAKWQNRVVDYYIYPNGAKDMSTTCAVGEIRAGADTWNQSSGIILNYKGPPTTFTGAINRDDENIVFFRDEPSGTTIAVTYLWYTRKGGMIAFDMIFYDQWAFFSFLSGCTGTCTNGFNLQTIAAHEFGHAIGLDHNRCTDSLMYPYADYCGVDLLSIDDTACAQSLYGP